MDVSVVYATFPDEVTASRIARVVLEKRLAACVTMWPSRSLYWWEGNIEDTAETLAFFKTTPRKAVDLVHAITEEHPYDVPCVLRIATAQGVGPYADYVMHETQTKGR